MADDKVGVEQTGDLLRPVRSRPTGTKAIAWYGIVGVLAIVAIVYLVGIFAAPKPHDLAAASSLSGTTATQGAAETYRYSGKVVNERRMDAKRVVQPGGAATPAPGAATRVDPPTAAPTPLIRVPRDDGAAATVVRNTRSDVPDVSDAIASRVRVALPTPAPDDGAGGTRTSVGPHRQGIMVVYGAPNTAATPVPAADGAAAPSPIQIALASPPPGGDPRATPSDAGGLGGLRNETMPGYRRAPLARYMVSAGTPITVQLDVAVESDVAGPVVAHVVRDVVDQLSGKTLIPGGTKALGDYAGLAAGQSRLSFVWRRFVFPDRSSFALDKVPALDDEGRVGVGGRLDTHQGPLVRRSFLGGILAEIARRINGQASGNNVVVINTGVGSQAGLPQAMLDLANQLNQRDANLPPVVTIKPNAMFTLYVDRDMLFDAPYTPMPAGSAAP
jgi:type IV secretory pathway VirB10-like protein